MKLMSRPHPDQETLKRFLLGTLPEHQLVDLEDRAFADPDLLELIDAAEADLIDTYVHGELPPEIRRIFEARFLASPERRRKVEFARTLAEAADEHVTRAQTTPARPERSWRHWFAIPAPAAGLALAGLAALVWIATQNVDLRQRIEQYQGQTDTLTRETQSLRQELQAQAGKSIPTPIATLLLLPGLTRSASNTPTLTVASDAQLARVEIQLEARDQFASYKGELSANGKEILRQANLRSRPNAGGMTITLDFPATALSPGQYELAIKGQPANGPPQDLGYFYFRVTH